MPVIIEELIVETEPPPAGQAGASNGAEVVVAGNDERTLTQMLALIAERQARLQVD